MLSQDRQLECTVARAGILEVDEPYPAAIPQEIGQGRVTVSQDGMVTGMAVTLKHLALSPGGGHGMGAQGHRPALALRPASHSPDAQRP